MHKLFGIFRDICGKEQSAVAKVEALACHFTDKDLAIGRTSFVNKPSGRDEPGQRGALSNKCGKH
jgi:hypothetical protein